MTTFIATFAVFMLVIAAMSIGYIIKRRSIHGSCGGIANLGLEKVCDCPEPCDNRKAKMAEQARLEKLQENRII
ncbi:MAG: (Na+)-NQR maturation NqrM [Plesiomonas sp.]|uniref:(Na+)-NQR maturation NqrM n=1 Tax=Plesiomonas sp. TaxID=2486279 RepID=UPI003EE7572D